MCNVNYVHCTIQGSMGRLTSMSIVRLTRYGALRAKDNSEARASRWAGRRPGLTNTVVTEHNYRKLADVPVPFALEP
jgi:hypothetical protein